MGCISRLTCLFFFPDCPSSKDKNYMSFYPLSDMNGVVKLERGEELAGI